MDTALTLLHSNMQQLPLLQLLQLTLAMLVLMMGSA
jgi:hypothetical protein